MPKGIITRLIVRQHHHIRSQELVWARGVVFRFAGCDILVLEQETERDGLIQIEVKGKGRQGIRALDFVRNEIGEIHEKWFSDIDFQPYVPCNCPDCQGDQEPKFFPLDELTQYLEEGESTIICRRGKIKSVPVRPMLDGVYDEAFIFSQMEKMHGRRSDDVHVRLSVDHRETNERLDRIQQGVLATEQMSTIIQSNQHAHSALLNSLLHYAKKHAADLQATFSKVDALSPAEQPDLDRLNTLLDERFGALIDKRPSSHDIVQKWKEANAKNPLTTDSKLKLKLKLPFIFGELEKEFAWDSKAAFRALRSELTAFAKGERTIRELFLEE